MKVLARRALPQDWLAWRVSPQRFRLVATAAVWALALTVISGAAVRLTGSGLGCPDWPACTASSAVAPLQFHAWVEFGNRLINAFVSIASIGAFGAALLRAPRRRDLTVLAGGLFVGILAEVVLGGLTVLSKLAPGFVMAHFLLAVLILADAVALRHQAGVADDRCRATKVPQVGRAQLGLARLQLVATAVVITLGTVVTSTGPHGGSPSVPRFGFSLHTVAQLHGASVEVLLGITLVAMWSLVRSGAPPSVIRRAQLLLMALVAQAAVGYLQYFNGDPVGLVAVHVTGACVLVIATLWYYLGLTIRTPSEDLAGTGEVCEHVEGPDQHQDPALSPAR